MSQAPSMPMYWDAYLADTTHLSTEEHGAYLLLLAAMWRRNGSVPDDDKDNARILGMTVAKWRKTKARLAATISGFRVEGGVITQSKLQKTWENTQEKIAKNAANGAKGGRAKSRKINDLGKANATNSLKRKASIPEPEPEPDIKSRDTNVSLVLSAPELAGPLAEAVAAYNETAEQVGWPKVQKLTPARSQALKARLRDAGGIEGWRIAMDKGKASDFLCGRTPKPWNGCGFDWMTKQANFAKLMEGNYDNRTNHSRQPSNRPRNGSDPALEQIARLARLS